MPGTVPPGTWGHSCGFTIEKLAMFSLGAFSVYQGHLAGPSTSLSLSYLIFPLVPISVFFRRAAWAPSHSLSHMESQGGGIE